MKHANISIFVPHVGCPNQCSFCNQHSISGVQAVPDATFVAKTCTDALEFMGERAKNAEIAFFGGSFTAIDRALMISLLEAAFAFVQNGSFKGIRISTRPDAIDEEILSLLRCYGVTAIELGAQSMDNGVLRKNQRGHTAQDVTNASQLIRRYGFELGLQMMVGLYGDTPETVMKTAQKLALLRPDTVRIYPTVVIRHTMLAELYEQGAYTPITVQEAVQISAKLLELFEGSGIRVIRLGLHASDVLERDILAGGYHPALRELCEAELFRKSMLTALAQQNILQGNITIRVPKGCVSKAIGQHKSNLTALQSLGYHAKFTEDNTLTGYSCIIQQQIKEVEHCI
ncbi:radical SAM protein [Hydrogenoanaerobacterium sp.]|uniref:elongator complex protein 3 n=1 Tax=Hydrogenoanaerobacterium sp. TaxID=2953763 RepID=UPI002898AE44|nr:radical SAM protein [Hydrogenoanaerobacterium sp.]